MSEITPGKGYKTVPPTDRMAFTGNQGCELGFWKHIVSGRAHYQCKYHKQTKDGRVFFCNYDYRSDKHAKRGGIHTHSTNIISTPIDQLITKSEYDEKDCDEIYLKIAHFLAVSNLSLDKATSPELFDIIYSALKYFRENYSEFRNANPETIIPRIGPAKIRNILVESSNQIIEIMIEELSHVDYFSICLDAGSIKSRHFVDLIAWSDKTYFSIFIKDTLALTSEGYADLAIECLNDPKIQSLNEKVAAFVGDGLPAQVSGLSPGTPHSFQNKVTNNALKKIIFSPCYNHRLQNAFKKTYRECSSFSRLIRSIQSLSIFLRKPENIKIIGAVCPKPIETRWNYLYDICFFFSKISSFRQNSDNG